MAKTITPELLEREEKVREYIEEYAELFDLDANLVRALITQESKFVGTAKSPTGAFGYGQFTNIAAKQVQIISAMNPHAKDLSGFQKEQASDPDKGIKAVCATLWWLFNPKYNFVEDKKIKFEAVLTFYNAGGKAAALVIKRGGHSKALNDIKSLPTVYRSQALIYAPEVLEWFIAWHDAMEKTKVEVPSHKIKEEEGNPFVLQSDQDLPAPYRPLIEALKLLDIADNKVQLVINVREGMTEVTLLLPGEY